MLKAWGNSLSSDLKSWSQSSHKAGVNEWLRSQIWLDSFLSFNLTSGPRDFGRRDTRRKIRVVIYGVWSRLGWLGQSPHYGHYIPIKTSLKGKRAEVYKPSFCVNGLDQSVTKSLKRSSLPVMDGLHHFYLNISSNPSSSFLSHGNPWAFILMLRKPTKLAHLQVYVV